MSTTLFLRTASALTFIHAVTHTIGGVFGKPAPGAQQAAVTAMKLDHFLVMGLQRTYWDFHMGLGLAVGIMLLAESIVFWQLGSLSGPQNGSGLRLRPVLWTFLFGYTGLAIVAFKYFFAPPVAVELLIALCLGLAIYSSKAAAPRPVSD
jgi:hypothetical protein